MIHKSQNYLSLGTLQGFTNPLRDLVPLVTQEKPMEVEEVQIVLAKATEVEPIDAVTDCNLSRDAQSDASSSQVEARPSSHVRRASKKPESRKLPLQAPDRRVKRKCPLPLDVPTDVIIEKPISKAELKMRLSNMCTWSYDDILDYMMRCHSTDPLKIPLMSLDSRSVSEGSRIQDLMRCYDE
jgi:hypothetical protein